MNTIPISLFVLWIAAVSSGAAPLPRWQVTLSDGSRIELEPKSETLQLASKPLGAKLAIPISAIRVVEPVGDRGVSVELGNGDHISGHLKGPPLKARALFGDILIAPRHIRKIESSSVPTAGRKMDPPGKFQLDYAGLRWDLWRTGWHVENGKLASQRHIRPGFRYGHWANGRGGLAITGNGDKSWTDYEVSFDYKMLPANREFFHAHIPGDSRGLGVTFRAAEVTESWNQPDTCYSLGINPEGGWSLGANNRWYMPGNGWSPSKRAGKNGKLGSGKAKNCKDPAEAHLRLRVRGQTITAWLDGEQLFEITHDGGELEPIPYGGFGVSWKWEAMGEISNLKVKHLGKMSPGRPRS